MNKLGIDFGTSQSSVSFVNSEGKPEVVKFIGHEFKMPSIVTFFPDDKPKTGFEAMSFYDDVDFLPVEQQMALFSKTALSIKSRLQPSGEACCGYSHLDIVSQILSKLRDEAQKSCSPRKFDELVLTHPVQFEEWKKDMLRKASRKAGFNRVHLLEEPVSAALGYMRPGNMQDIKGMIVYDFGAGTFDTTYIINSNGSLRIPIPPAGDSKCGGDDIDEALYRHLCKRAGYKPVPKDIGLLFKCRRWKEMLCTQTSIPVTIPKAKFSGTLTREELNECMAPIIDKTVAMTKKIYEEVKDNRLPLDIILLIGGSSVIPLISDNASSG